MIKALKRLFRPQVVLERKYEAAQVSRFTEEYWSNATQASADALLINKLEKLRDRARYVTRNNSYAAGMVDTLANDTVGSGPRLQLESGNMALDERIEDRFAAWAYEPLSIDLMGKQTLGEMLQGCIKAFCTAGEDFVGHAVEDGLYKIFKIEADRIATPYGQSLNTQAQLGIEKDSIGRPTAYWINRSHPGATLPGLPSNFDRVSADQIIHLYRIDRPDQSRGVPWLTPALERFADFVQYNKAVIKAAERAASISAVTTGEDPDSLSTYTSASDIPEFDIPIDTILRMSGEQTIAQLKAEQPTTTYEAYARATLNECARCLNMPLNIALANSSQYNYASGRLDHQVYFKFLFTIRSYLERHLLNAVFRRWLLSESFRMPGAGSLNLATVMPKWYWPGREHADPQKEASSQDIKLTNGTLTLEDAWAEQGQDWRRKIDRMAEIQAYAAEKGVTLGQHSAPQPNFDENGEPENGEPETQETETAATE